MKKTFLLLLFVLTPLFLSALDCAACGKRIRGNYIKTARAAYCTKRCFNSTLQNCAGCGGKCTRQVITFLGRKFCSKDCMHRTIRCQTCSRGADQMIEMISADGHKIMICRNCRNLPGCYFCMLPSAKRLHDGRHICNNCMRTAVTDHHEIRRIFRQVRRNMGHWFGYDQRHRIELEIVPVRELNRQSKSVYLPQGGKRLSLMKYERKVTEKRYSNGRTHRYISGERCRIFILDSIPRDMLYDTIAHELTHDHLRHNLGKVKDLAEEEGFCELTASIYNEKIGNDRLNKLKEMKKDPVYGGGYRKMRAVYLRNGRNWRRTLRAIKAEPKRI